MFPSLEKVHGRILELRYGLVEHGADSCEGTKWQKGERTNTSNPYAKLT
jgi:hypothetical protein